MTEVLTKHAQLRMSGRKISTEEINLCLNYGKRFHKTGITFYILLKGIIREYGLPERLSGLCVLLQDGVVITVYKNKEAASQVKKLNKYKRKVRS